MGKETEGEQPGRQRKFHVEGESSAVSGACERLTWARDMAIWLVTLEVTTEYHG